MNANKKKIATIVSGIVVVIVIVVVLLGWKKWGWFSSESDDNLTNKGIPGDVSNVSFKPVKETNSGSRSYYTDTPTEAGLKISFTSPSSTGITNDNTFKGYMIELTDNDNKNYIVEGNNTFQKNSFTINYFDFNDVSDINEWNSNKKNNVVNTDCEIFIPIKNIADLNDGSEYTVKIKAINNSNSISANAAESDLITYDACEAGDSVACGWPSGLSGNDRPPSQSIIESIVELVGSGTDADAGFIPSVEVGGACRPDDADVNTLYKYNEILECVPFNCNDGFVFENNACVERINAGDSCDDGKIYYQIGVNDNGTPILSCQSSTTPPDCKDPTNYKVQGSKCVAKTCEDDYSDDVNNPNVAEWQGTWGTCEPSACKDPTNYKVQGSKCVAKTCEDDYSDVNNPNVAGWQGTWGTCKPSACNVGYMLENDTCSYMFKDFVDVCYNPDKKSFYFFTQTHVYKLPLGSSPTYKIEKYSKWNFFQKSMTEIKSVMYDSDTKYLFVFFNKQSGDAKYYKFFWGNNDDLPVFNSNSYIKSTIKFDGNSNNIMKDNPTAALYNTKPSNKFYYFFADTKIYKKNASDSTTMTVDEIDTSGMGQLQTASYKWLKSMNNNTDLLSQGIDYDIDIKAVTQKNNKLYIFTEKRTDTTARKLVKIVTGTTPIATVYNTWEDFMDLFNI